MAKCICYECTHCMRVKIMVETPAARHSGLHLTGNAVQMVEGAACKLSSVPIGGPATTLECSEFESRAEPILMRKPEPVKSDA